MAAIQQSIITTVIRINVKLNMIRIWGFWIGMLCAGTFLTGFDYSRQQQSDFTDRFRLAEHHFHYKEFDEALEVYRSLPEPVCSSPHYAELCIKSHILRANIYRNRGESLL